ncbi:MAG: hypothetical protein KIT81_10200 [Alphaproteobacteria bacterium]|nr:hypothetical protein [Alphaproteobacteria bacterium]
MTRYLLQALLFLVPFIVYFGYLLLLRRGEERGWNTAPWTWLAVSGLLLVAASFLVLGLTDDSRPGQYVPPRYIDGKLLPAETR